MTASAPTRIRSAQPEKQLLMFFANAADNDGVSYYSVAAIEWYTGLDRATIKESPHSGITRRSPRSDHAYGASRAGGAAPGRLQSMQPG